MVYIILGPPGAGKGTLSQYLVDKRGITHISTGDILRERIKAQDKFAKEIEAVLDSGGLLEDDVIDKMMIETVKDASDILFDGYPRSIRQAEFIEKNYSVSGVILVSCPDDVIIARLSARRVCPKCGRVYNLKTMPPKKDNLCDVCGVSLIQRDDDKSEAISIRLKNYHKITQPLIDFYRKRNLLFEVNGDAELDDFLSEGLKVFDRIKH